MAGTCTTRNHFKFLPNEIFVYLPPLKRYRLTHLPQIPVYIINIKKRINFKGITMIYI